MINKLKTFKIEKAQLILGGQDSDTQTRIHEMIRETNLNRAKSASKLHNKMVQLIMS